MLVSWFVVSPGILFTVECLMMVDLVQHGSTFPICCPSNEDDAHPPAFFGKKNACIFLEQHFLLMDNICHLGWFSNVEVDCESFRICIYIISTISTGDLVHLVVGYSIIV